MSEYSSPRDSSARRGREGGVHPRWRRRLPVTVAIAGILASAAVGLHRPASAQAPAPAVPIRPSLSWATGWYASPQPAIGAGPSLAGFGNQTIRQVVRVHATGTAVRVQVANTFSNRPLRVGAAAVAALAPAAAPGTFDRSVDRSASRPLRFSGERSVTVPAGAVVLSDPVALPVTADRELAVDVYLPVATGPATWHALAQRDSWVAAGNRVGVPAGGTFGTAVPSWFFLDEVQVLRRPSRTVVAFGDSITDGHGSTAGADCRYPDYLARDLAGWAVVNAGIDGNRLTTDANPYGAIGTNALSRLDRDVLARPGVTDLVLLEGLNDLGGGVRNWDAASILTVLRQAAGQARAHGIRAWVGTLTPMGGAVYPGFAFSTPQGEAVRKRVNAALRTGAGFDGVIDFDRAVRDPAHPVRLRPAFDSGDHLHPNDAGYRAMATTAAGVLAGR